MEDQEAVLNSEEATAVAGEEAMDTSAAEVAEAVAAVMEEGVSHAELDKTHHTDEPGIDLDAATCKAVENAVLATGATTDVNKKTNTSGELNSELDPLEENDDDDLIIKDMDDSTFGNITDLFGSSGGGAGAGAGEDSSFNVSDSNNNGISSHTFRKTEWDVKKLENHVRLTYGDTTTMENMTPAMLNKYLRSFFEFAKKSDGMEYEPESLIGFMNSFERFLKTKNYPESLLRSDVFKESRLYLKKKRDMVRSIGKLIRTKTKDTFYILQYHRNLLKEKGLLNRDNPDGLLAEVSCST